MRNASNHALKRMHIALAVNLSNSTWTCTWKCSRAATTDEELQCSWIFVLSIAVHILWIDAELTRCLSVTREYKQWYYPFSLDNRCSGLGWLENLGHVECLILSIELKRPVITSCSVMVKCLAVVQQKQAMLSWQRTVSMALVETWPW